MNLLGQLFLSFLQIGMFAIGGGYATIPLIQEQVVDLHHWLNFQEFTDIITISQMTPGPIAVNTSTFVGIRIAGIGGAVVATLGCVLTGFFVSVLLYRFFSRHAEAQGVIDTLKGLRAASAGLIASSACTILLIAFCGTSERDFSQMTFNPIALGIFAGGFFLLRRFRLNPILVMVLSGVAGLICYSL